MTRLRLTIRANGRTLAMEREHEIPYGAWATIAHDADRIIGPHRWTVAHDDYLIERSGRDAGAARLANAVNRLADFVAWHGAAPNGLERW